MKVLLLSFYFRPDLCAGSFRNTAFVESLQKKLPKGSCIDVITTLPNRYSSFDVDAPKDECIDGVRVKRVALPEHESGMIDQSRSYMTFALAVREHVANQSYDIVVASSSRLMTAALGAWVARRKNIPLYLDVRDIFVDTIKDVLPRRLAPMMMVFFSWVERWTLMRANRLNVVSAGFLPYFEERYPAVSKVVFTNGIDDEFLTSSATNGVVSGHDAGEKTIVNILYAGNMGEGQGLHNIIPALAKNMEGRATFRLIGDGGRKGRLEDAVRVAGCNNVLISQPVSRMELKEAYEKADVLFLHLNNYQAFRKVLPSKLFEYGALGKPIWAGVAGYPAKFISEEMDNVAVFSPCDSDEAIQAFENLVIADTPRPSFVEKFSRRRIMDSMADDLLSLLDTHI